MRRFLICLGVICALLIPAASRAADRDNFLIPDVTYDAGIPTPEEALGHRLGEAPVRYHEMVDYLTMVAESSPRMTVEVIGYSHERRPILSLVVTSPENHANLAAIKAAHIALTVPGSGQTVSDDMPVVTWLNYGVHGAEASGMDAVLPTVYHLAAAQGADIERSLQNSVILITAAFNPDGHSRRAAWFDSYLSEVVNTDPAHRLHNQAWPGWRTNHYWFDLNRQWLLLTQPESRAWVAKWHEWRPNVSVDYHEMGTNQTYYFHPGVTTRTNPNVPAEAIELMNVFSEAPAAFMDSESRLYFNQERFDNFYIGKGSTFPLVHGAVGILFEAGSGVGRAIESDNGLKTYRDNIRTHFRTSLASIAGALSIRGRLLDYQNRFYQGTPAAADDDPIKAYVFSAGGDRSRLYHFLDLLERQRVQTYQLAAAVSANGHDFEPGDAVIVPLKQAQYHMIKAMFERITEFADKTFYDVSAWTLPLAFNLKYAELSSRQFKRNLQGAAVKATLPTADAPDQAPYAYMIDWTDYYAPRALYRILDKGILARTITKPITVATTKGPVRLNRGAIIVPLERQGLSNDDIHGVMSDIAKKDGIVVHAVTGGRAVEDGGDLGAPSFRSLEKPVPLLIAGPAARAYDTGELWHLLDYRMNIPVTIRGSDRLGNIDLQRYTHIILPGGNYDKFDEKLAQRIAQWVKAGGTLIAMRQAAIWANDTVLAEPKSDGEETEVQDKQDEGEEPQPRSDYANKDTQDALDIIGGAIFGGDLDISHPLGFGYGWRDIASHRNTTIVLEPPKNRYATVVRYKDAPLLSGYASEKNRLKIAGSAMLIAERKGRGSVILFADNPNFRAVWYGTNKLFLNALFFGTAFDAPRESD